MKRSISYKHYFSEGEKVCGVILVENHHNKNMQKLYPHLWFDKGVKEATTFYTSVFPESKVHSISTITGTPSGDCDIVSFSLMGQDFMAIDAGPYFVPNPSISFMVALDSVEEVDRLWNALIDGGTALMEINSYPFSERYGWLKDKYGFSWQLMYSKETSVQSIAPSLLFVGDVCGKAEEAKDFYISIFKGTDTPGHLDRYDGVESQDKAGTLKYARFSLFGKELVVMDSAYAHEFAFNEAISLVVECDNQEEIDYYWERLSAAPESEQCGWLKDKYGVSWQIVPSRMNEMMKTGTKEQVERLTASFLQMKKFNIAELERAFNNQ